MVIIPLFSIFPEAVLISIAGCIIGSLIPDIDSRDAVIFHTEVKEFRNSGPLSALNTFALIFPLFGYLTKYCIYKPSVIVFNTLIFSENSLKMKHRGFMHSILGISTSTLVTGIYITPFLIFFDLFSIHFLIIFLSGYLLGAFLHLVQDSCTRSGVKWLHPYSDLKVRGNLITNARPENTRYQRFFLKYLTAVGLLVLITSTVYSEISSHVFSVYSFVLAALSWLVFVKFLARCRTQ